MVLRRLAQDSGFFRRLSDREREEQVPTGPSFALVSCDTQAV